MGGCSSKKQKKIFYEEQVICAPYKTSIEELDNLLIELKPLLVNIEKIRESFATSWTEMQNFSGLTVLEEKSIRTLLICIHYRLASELTTDTIETMSFEKTSPWFIFEKKFEYLLTIEARSYIKKIKDFLTFGQSLKNETDEVYKNYKSKLMTVKEEFDKIEMEKMTLEDKEKMHLVIEKNKALVEHAYTVISYINNILNKMDEGIESIQADIKNKSLIQDMVKISKDYASMKNYNARSVVLKYSKEKKSNTK